MNFKIPHSLLYFAVGLNVMIFFMGAALEQWSLSLLAIFSSMLCLTPILFGKEE